MEAAREGTTETRRPMATIVRSEPLSGAYFWLIVFYIIYCGRPEDWIPGLHVLPLAKISGAFTLLALGLSVGRSKRGLPDLPREALYLLLLMLWLMASAVLSPVWRGGAVNHTLDFSKSFVAAVAIMLTVTTLARFRQLLLIQAGCVAIISVVSVVKGHSLPRLEGALGGIYSNPNELAMAIVLALPLCFALLLTTRSLLKRTGWALGMLVMLVALFFTASRAGFIALIVAAAVSLWHFGVKGRRPIMVAVSVLAVALLTAFLGGKLKERFFAISGEDIQGSLQSLAYSSYEARKLNMELSLQAIEQHPLFGLGLRNFPPYSGTWMDVHNAYLQIACEGGIPALILYMLFFWRAFGNLRRMRKYGDLDRETTLYASALHATLFAFLFGALFAPVAYQFFPFFTATFTWILLAITEEKGLPGVRVSTVFKGSLGRPGPPGRSTSLLPANQRTRLSYRKPSLAGEK